MNTTLNNSNINFSAKVKPYFITGDRKTVKRTKPLLNELAPNEVTFRVSQKYDLPHATLKGITVSANKKSEGKRYQGEFSEFLDREATDSEIISSAKKALEEMNLHIRQKLDIKTEKRLNTLM